MRFELSGRQMGVRTTARVAVTRRLTASGKVLCGSAQVRLEVNEPEI
jgi:hypothetical protein